MAGVGMVDMAEAVARCTALETDGSLAPEAMKAQAVAIHTYIPVSYTHLKLMKK